MTHVFIGILIAALLVGLLAVWLIWRARRPVPITMAPAQAPHLHRPLRERAAGWLTVFYYLITRREWRYDRPWVLLVGEAGAGKSSLIASCSMRIRREPQPREARLAARGTEWHFFNQGVLIDPRGDWACATPGSTEAHAWQAMLGELSDLRPERALDSLVLAISARTLLERGQEARDQLADRLYHQLYTIQSRLEFALPVYVVITQCDHVAGFAAYWRALSRRSDDASRDPAQMFGWSAPGTAESRTGQEWADEAFDMLHERLKALQLDTAADCDEIDDADRFFLFPRHFQGLRAPVARCLTLVFRSAPLYAGFFFRGLYFTGSIEADGAPALPGDRREDVDFVDDVIEHKVLAEPLLARRTRTGIWSRSRLIRRAQFAGCALIAALLLGLAFSGAMLYRQAGELRASLDLIEAAQADPGGACGTTRDTVYRLIERLAGIRAHLYSPFIPVSWFDTRVRDGSAEVIAEKAFKRVILPSMACQLNHRMTRTLQDLNHPPQPVAHPAYVAQRRRLFDDLRAITELERNIKRFTLIANDNRRDSRELVLREFAALAHYLYGKPLPAAVAREHGAYSNGLIAIVDETPLAIPQALRAELTRHLQYEAERLGTQLAQEVGQGRALLTQLQRDEGDVLAATQHFTWWLAWVRGEWLRGSQQDPCAVIRRQLVRDLDTLIALDQRYVPLLGSQERFGEAACSQPAMRQLVALQLPAYGPVFTPTRPDAGTLADGKAYVLNPALLPELDGLTALAALDFMQISPTPPFQCRPAMTGWRPEQLAAIARHARDYQAFARKQGLAPQPGLAGRPLYDRLARRQLQHAFDATMTQAQHPAPAEPMLTRVSLQTLADADQRLAAESADFSRSVDPLLTALRLYRQLGFADSATRVTQCARDHASDTLATLDTLAEASRLYDPSNDAADASLFTLGTTPVVKDYLSRQVARAGVLAGYATPYVVFLQNAEVIDEAHADNGRTAVYWANTLNELARYQQGREPNAQVGALDDLFLKQLSSMTYANCRAALAAYRSPDPGNDLFSARRVVLEQKVGLRCKDQRQAEAFETWRGFATRFNRELAGRYPFGPLVARDAPLGTVKRFFADYAGERARLEKALEDIPVEYLEAANGFLARLDAVNAFFGSNLTAGDVSQPLQLDMTFRAQAADSPGSEQLIGWTLTSAERSAGHPNRAATLPWAYGQMLVLALQWADRSQWRPLPDARQDDLQVEGQTASFVALGEWALLRLIATHAPRGVLTRDAADPTRLLLEFNVATANAGQPPGRAEVQSMRAYLGLKLTGQDPKTRAAVALTLPEAFPQRAPLLQ
ncbi:type VI secretion system protein [Chitiniphilus purpureus]|uniref:Type VI secretion system protein n=1 Tax=Chitiniphilus purpureus TaxID=2981137 RepID=A0ABY6DTA4_9NEIS|nr:type VI secretion system protein [Chitiniphilus sp. CD1]UXY17252.1 type VI secretion system protein [Chitiniphilus sp. CD1]